MIINNNITKRETTSIYEDSGRKFRLNSFDPIEGNYILIQLITFAIPFGIGDLVGKAVSSESSEINNVTSMLEGNKTKMSKEDFVSFEKDILKTIEEVYDGGESSPVLRENGTYGIANISMPLVIKLIVASLAFNFRSFFEEMPSLEEFINH